MKRRTKIIIVIIVVGVVMLLSILLLPKNSLTEQAAIEAVKQKYPTLRDYPSDKLPPRTISTTKLDNKWYIAFIQNGSGRPILEAHCFIVYSDHSISENGTFTPKADDNTQSLSPITCSAH